MITMVVRMPLIFIENHIISENLRFSVSECYVILGGSRRFVIRERGETKREAVILVFSLFCSGLLGGHPPRTESALGSVTLFTWPWLSLFHCSGKKIPLWSLIGWTCPHLSVLMCIGKFIYSECPTCRPNNLMERSTTHDWTTRCQSVRQRSQDGVLCPPVFPRVAALSSQSQTNSWKLCM